MNIDSTMLRKMIAQQIQEYGDHETQARGGEVASNYSSDPEMDQTEDIGKTVAEQGGGIEEIAAALSAEGFKVSAQGRTFYIDGKYVIGSPKDIGQDDQTPVLDTKGRGVVLATLHGTGVAEGAGGSGSKKDFVKQAWEKAGATSRDVSDEEAGAVESFNNWRAADPVRQKDWEEAQSYRGGRVLAYHVQDSVKRKPVGKYYDVQSDMYVDDKEMDAILPEAAGKKNLSNDYITRLIQQTIKEVEGEPESESDPKMKDVTKAADKMKSSAMAPLFAKINSPDEFEALFKEFINVAAAHPAIKKTAVKRILINFAKQLMKQKGKEGQ